MAQEANKKIAVRVALNDTVYIVDGQGLYKTYIDSIYCKQRFDTDGNIIQQITYGVPATEIGNDVTNKFVIGDFGVSIFTSLPAAYKKFTELSAYAKDNQGVITGNSKKEEYLSAGTGDGAQYNRETVLTNNDPNGVCNFDCYNCTSYDECNKNEKKSESINVGTGQSDLKGYIKIKNEPDVPEVPAKVYSTTVSARGTYTYYDSTGRLVASSTGDNKDFTTYTNSSGEKAVGDITRVKYYDYDGNIIYRLGDLYDTGPFVYQDGSAVRAGTTVLQKVELVGNADIGPDGITYSSDGNYYGTSENNNIIDISE